MKTHKTFEALAEDLADVGIVKSNMFGMPVLKLGKKPICGLDHDGINFKLPIDSPEYEQALSLDGSHLFQPEMKGKKGPLMKQWVVVPFAYSSAYVELAMASIKFVEASL